MDGTPRNRAHHHERLRLAIALAHDLSPSAPPVIETVLGHRSAEWDQVKSSMADELAAWAKLAEEGGVTICFGVVLERVARFAEVNAREERQRLCHVLVLKLEHLAIDFVGQSNVVRPIEIRKSFEIAIRVVRDAEEIVARWIGEVRHGRGRTAQDKGQRGLDSDAGERCGIREAGLVNGAVKNAIVDNVVVWIAVFPITR